VLVKPTLRVNQERNRNIVGPCRQNTPGFLSLTGLAARSLNMLSWTIIQPWMQERGPVSADTSSLGCKKEGQSLLIHPFGFSVICFAD